MSTMTPLEKQLSKQTGELAEQIERLTRERDCLRDTISDLETRYTEAYNATSALDWTQSEIVRARFMDEMRRNDWEGLSESDVTALLWAAFEATHVEPDQSWQDRTPLSEPERQIENLTRERDRLERDLEYEILARDKAHDALAETHRCLGGDGEWVYRTGATEPGSSGDLHVDAPELARIVTRERDEARAEVEKLKRSAKVDRAVQHRLLAGIVDDELERLRARERELLEALEKQAIEYVPEGPYLATAYWRCRECNEKTAPAWPEPKQKSHKPDCLLYIKPAEEDPNDTHGSD